MWMSIYLIRKKEDKIIIYFIFFALKIWDDKQFVEANEPIEMP